MAGDLPEYPQRLFEVITTTVPTWIERVMLLACDDSDNSTREKVKSRVGDVQRDTLAYVTEQLNGLLATDVDDQRSNPLEVLRSSTKYANAVLRDARVSPPARDEFQQRLDPDDEFLLGPMSWMDLGESVHEAGIEWGAWKAATVLTRRRAEGKLS